MQRVDSDFKNRVYEIVAQIPKGRVATYGQIAALAGAAWAAWEVGQIAHTGPSDLPWQRVVNKQGGLARGYPGGLEGHKQAIVKDGIAVDDNYQVNIKELLWLPIHPDQSSLL
ncbi:MAG TPA: MGMT family protein [Candidatus Saccharimonadales bacterium]|nr:MGMT family protein [Candidatus Saccharimonadales bacterium]